MRVATWNLWWRFGPWEARQRPIATELARVDADVTCLQEVWSTDEADQALVLAETLGCHHARTTRSDGGPHPFGNAVLSRWPILESSTMMLPGADGEPSHRSALFCRIDVPEAPHAWWVVSTHLEWRYTASRLRQQQLQVIVAEVERIIAGDAQAIVVLGGDFNAVAESDEIRKLTGLAEPYSERLIFTDSWAAVGDGDGHTWVRENTHSANAQWPRRRLDSVFVSWPRPKPTGNPLVAELFGLRAHPTGDTTMSGEPATEVPSDHYGVVVTLDRRSASDLEPS